MNPPPEKPRKVTLTKRKKSHEEVMTRYYNSHQKQINLHNRILKYQQMVDDINMKLSDLRQFVNNDLLQEALKENIKPTDDSA